MATPKATLLINPSVDKEYSREDVDEEVVDVVGNRQI